MVKQGEQGARLYTDGQRAQFRKWVVVDGLSASQTAALATEAWGRPITRNAACGLAKRMGIRFGMHSNIVRHSKGGRPKKDEQAPRMKAEPAPHIPPLNVKQRVVHNPFGKRGAPEGPLGANIQHKAEVRPYKPPTPVVVTIDAATYDRESEQLLLEALTSTSCKFPVNDPPRPGNEPHLFCGAVVRNGSSYCDHHHARTHGAGTSPERHAHKALQVKALEAAW